MPPARCVNLVRIHGLSDRSKSTRELIVETLAPLLVVRTLEHEVHRYVEDSRRFERENVYSVAETPSVELMSVSAEPSSDELDGWVGRRP